MTFPHLCNNSVQYVHQHKMKHGVCSGIETYLEEICVVWIDTKVGQEAVYHQVKVLPYTAGASRERLARVK